MRTSADCQTINHFLGNRGFATLSEPGALVQQLAFCVENHEQFRKALTKCEPQDRRDMYEAMKPHLRFEAKPLDVYMAEASQDAENRQLPVIAADGSLQAFQRTEINSDAFIIEKAIADDLAKHTLVMTCKKCTFVDQFKGIRKADAIQAARNAGWTYDELSGTGREICPKCLGGSKLN